jgi:hypothetical protein
MKKVLSIIIIVLAAAVFIVPPGYAQESAPKSDTGQAEVRKDTKPAREKHPVLCYLPNRIFDMLDIVRLRLRVGPGVSVGARVTKLTNVFVGAHTSIFAGVYGPRGEAVIPWPIGVENHAGADVSLVDASVAGPYIGPLETGLEFQAGIIGINVGICPYEMLDLVTGLFFIDLQKDDF